MDRRPVGRGALVATVVALVVVAMAWPAASAAASVGAGVGADPLVLAEPARPGATYQLPDLLVVNTGSAAATYRLAITRDPKGRHRTVPPGWVHFSSATFELAPGARRYVPVAVTVPSKVVGGAYSAYVVASASTPSASDAHAGAAAATTLSFSIRPAPPPGIPWKPWAVAVLVLAVLSGAVVGVRRSGIRITVERRGPRPAR